jgi:tetratricopeptide (TPR) repeat protein
MLADLRPFITVPAAAPPPRRPHRRMRMGVIAALGILALAVLWYFTRAPLQPSPSAMRFYEEGVNAIRDGTYYKAAQTLQQAARLDGRYPLTHARLAEAWNELDYTDRAREEMLAAMPPDESAPRLSSTDVARLRAIHRVLTRDLSGAAEAYRGLARQLPQEEQASAFVDLGRVHEKSERLKDALAAFDTAAKLEPRYAAAFLRMGTVYRRLADARRAEESYQRAESLYSALSNVEGLTEVAYQRSVLANQSGRLDEARSLLTRALAMAEAGGSQHQRIKILLQLHSVCYRQGNTEEALRYATEGLESARRHGLPDLITRALTELGTNAQIRGDAREAVRYLADAIESARRHRGLNSEARARFQLASVRTDLGETEAAFDDVAKALAYYQSGGYRSQTASCTILLTRLKRKKGDFAGALRSAQDELAAARAAGNGIQEGYALGEIGRALLEQERYGEARVAYRQMREQAEARGYGFSLRYAIAETAETLWRAGRIEEARAAAAEAARLNAGGSDRPLAARIELLGAEMALAAGQLASARAAADRAAALRPDDRELAAAVAVLKGRAGDKAESARALEMTRALKNTRLTLNALLAHAETARDFGAAAEAASLAAAGGLIESEWRASLAAARSASDPAHARKYAEAAQAAFARLPQAIGPAEFQTWEARPDIRRVRGAKR